MATYLFSGGCWCIQLTWFHFYWRTFNYLAVHLLSFYHIYPLISLVLSMKRIPWKLKSSSPKVCSIHRPSIFSNYKDIPYNSQKNIIFVLYFPSGITLSILPQIDEIFNQNGFQWHLRMSPFMVLLIFQLEWAFCDLMASTGERELYSCT